MEILKTYRLADFGSGLIDETAELKLVAQVSLIKHSELDLDDGTNPHGTTKEDVGLGNVDNTSDVDKPISNATQLALNGKQNTLGFTPENVANKNNTTLNNSSTEYPTSGLVLKEREAIVVSTSQTAILNRVHNVVENATLTDPTPTEGFGYTVNVINGVATVGGVDYSVGSQLFRHYHSGSWRTNAVNGISHYIELPSDYTLNDTTAFQKLFNTDESGGTTGLINVTAGTYELEALIWIENLPNPTPVSSIRINNGSATISKYSIFLARISATQNSNANTTNITGTKYTIPNGFPMISGGAQQRGGFYKGEITFTSNGTFIFEIAVNVSQVGMLAKNRNYIRLNKKAKF